MLRAFLSIILLACAAVQEFAAFAPSTPESLMQARPLQADWKNLAANRSYRRSTDRGKNGSATQISQKRPEVFAILTRLPGKDERLPIRRGTFADTFLSQGGLSCA
jgi:hypothetical protein